jgi:hypothetical protein
MVQLLIEEGGPSPRLHPRTLSPDLWYTVRTVAVTVADPLTGTESTLWLGPRAFLEEFGGARGGS